MPQGVQEPVLGIVPGVPECVQQSEEGIVLDAKAVKINRQLGPCYPQRLPAEKSDCKITIEWQVMKMLANTI